MKKDNPFDKKMELQMPEAVRAAATEMNDALELCWLSAQSVFEDGARPEHALALLPILIERLDAKRQQ